MTKAKGNMYPNIWTHNIIKGKCPHGCTYCYMNSIAKRYNSPQKDLFFDEKALIPLGKGKTIFIGSSCDMWAVDIPHDWKCKVLEHCNKYQENTYLFQTKNPGAYMGFGSDMPRKTVLGTTIETNRIYHTISKTPPTVNRAINIGGLRYFERFITIEPIMDFDMPDFCEMLRNASPDYINIGADSGNNHLPEPEPDKIRELIKELEKFTKVNLKKNLKRLLPEVGV